MQSRRTFLQSLAGAAATAALARTGLAAESTRRPNFIVIFTDDQGYGDVGCYGAEGYATPNLDRMAAEGMRFTDFYVAGPVCTPSRSALMTGCYPKRLGLAHRVLFPYSDTGLNPNEVTVAEVLKEAGYATGCIGKWHLGHHPEFMPTRQGFDFFFGVPYSNDMHAHYYAAQDFQAPPLPLYRGEEVIESGPDQSLLTRRYTEEAVSFIAQHKDEPFFLYLPHTMPHLPIAASAAFEGSTEHGLYGDVIAEIDWSVGRILEALEEQGIDDNTLVVFTSDNGPVIWDGDRRGYKSGSAGPLRGMKNTTWEGGMREPCLMRWPGHVPAGSVCRELATAMDLLPTFAALAGTRPPQDRIIDGKDILPLMTGAPGASTPHEVFYYYRDDRLQAVRSGNWKLHVYRPEWDEKKYTGTRAPLLYDLGADIGETTDVAAENPDVVARLQQLAARARRDLGDAVTGDAGENVREVGQREAKASDGSVG